VATPHGNIHAHSEVPLGGWTGSVDRRRVVHTEAASTGVLYF